ncbi:MAG: MATE family efflux transporter [Corallococcus sp.]|nr:MATE family efflux transporter [Corallococcus sp.]MCM1358912.1 MATE family efflux transporter [Corallococcus sp.]MCM1394900.1 MATE family efflux transporter [Corallococcus sp.]
MESTEIYYKKMTETPVAKLVIKLGVPTTVAMLITSIYNLVDTYFVGTLGKSAQGAIGILFTLQSIIQAIAFMLGHGSGTYVAKELANRDAKKATQYVSSAFFLGGAIGIVFLAVGLSALNPILKLLGATETILPYARDYGLWVLISCPFMICSLVLNNNLRYEGKALFALVGLGTGGVLNMLLDWLFVFGCGLGVFGAGLATAISQATSFVILLILYLTKAQSSVSVKAISRDSKLYFSIFKNGLPSLIRQCLNSVSGGILNNLAGRYGEQIGSADAAIAAMSIVNRISNFVMCVGMGISQGLQPVASFNWQAQRYKRVKRAFCVTMIICFAGVAVLATPLIAAPQTAIGLFQKDETVANIAVPALRYAMAGLLFMPLFIPANMLFQSIRKAGIASFLALLRSGLIFIPLLYLFTFLWQITGLQIAQLAADALTALINLPFVIWFLKNTPKENGGETHNVETKQKKNS